MDDQNPKTSELAVPTLPPNLNIPQQLLASLGSSPFVSADGMVLKLSAAWSLDNAHNQGGPGRLLGARADFVPQDTLSGEWANSPLLPEVEEEPDWDITHVKFAVPTLPRDILVRDAFMWWGRQSTLMLMANEAAAIEGSNPGGVHQARVAIRRMRSAIRLFRKVIGPTEARHAIESQLKWIAGEMSDNRDLDVIALEYVPAVIEVVGSQRMKPLMEELYRAREAAHQRTYKALTSKHYRAAVGQICTWLEGGHWCAEPSKKGRMLLDKPLRTLASKWLNTVGSRVLQRGLATDWSNIPQCHDMRKEFKKLRYSSELLRGVLPSKRLLRLRKGAKQLQTTLGYLNDVDIAQEHMKRLLEKSPYHRRAALERAIRTAKRWHDRQARKRHRSVKAQWKALRKLNVLVQK